MRKMVFCKRYWRPFVAGAALFILYEFSQGPPVNVKFKGAGLLQFLTAFSRSNHEYLFGNTNLPWIFVITPTKSKLEQKADLTRLSQTLRHIRRLFWIVVDDASAPSAKVERVLKRSRVKYVHLATLGSFKTASASISCRGMKQRNLALDWLYNASTSVGHRMNAVVYFADDDNAYDVRLFDDYVRNVSGIGVWAVGGVKVETPVVKNGTVTGWDTHYAPKRPFAVDMAGFAVHLRLLLSKRHHFQEKWGKGHFETCFLEQLGVRREDVVPFGFDAGRRKELLVWHTKTSTSEGTGGTDKGFEI